MTAVECAGDRSTKLSPPPPLQPPASAGRPAQSAKTGGFPSRVSLGVHSNHDKQDLGGLTASICRPSKAEKKPQKCKTPSLCQMWFLNTGAQQADSQISKAPESRRVVEVPLTMPKVRCTYIFVETVNLTPVLQTTLVEEMSRSRSGFGTAFDTAIMLQRPCPT